VVRQLSGRAGHQDLAGVGRRPEVCAAGQRPTEVPGLLVKLRLGRLQGDTKTSGRQLQLNCQGGRYRVGRPGERRHGALLGRMYLLAHPPVEGDLFVEGLGHLTACIAGAGTTFDVCEQECDRAGGQIEGRRVAALCADFRFSPLRRLGWKVFPGLSHQSTPSGII
jgi:hypothetical protein